MANLSKALENLSISLLRLAEYEEDQRRQKKKDERADKELKLAEDSAARAEREHRITVGRNIEEGAKFTTPTASPTPVEGLDTPIPQVGVLDAGTQNMLGGKPSENIAMLSSLRRNRETSQARQQTLNREQTIFETDEEIRQAETTQQSQLDATFKAQYGFGLDDPRAKEIFNRTILTDKLQVGQLEASIRATNSGAAYSKALIEKLKEENDPTKVDAELRRLNQMLTDSFQNKLLSMPEDKKDPLIALQNAYEEVSELVPDEVQPFLLSAKNDHLLLMKRISATTPAPETGGFSMPQFKMPDLSTLSHGGGYGQAKVGDPPPSSDDPLRRQFSRPRTGPPSSNIPTGTPGIHSGGYADDLRSRFGVGL